MKPDGIFIVAKSAAAPVVPWRHNPNETNESSHLVPKCKSLGLGYFKFMGQGTVISQFSWNVSMISCFTCSLASTTARCMAESVPAEFHREYIPSGRRQYVVQLPCIRRVP